MFLRSAPQFVEVTGVYSQELLSPRFRAQHELATCDAQGRESACRVDGEVTRHSVVRPTESHGFRGSGELLCQLLECCVGVRNISGGVCAMAASPVQLNPVGEQSLTER